MASRSTFKGVRRKLVLAFDVGTTYSGISYSILDPGQVPEVKGVTRFPAHELISGASKIPTITYYDPQGKVRAVGAEAIREGIQDQAEDERWVKAEWFKLHLRSQFSPGAGQEVSDKIPSLPLNKTVVEVFADFLAYLLQCASEYIQETHPNGVHLWASLKGQIDYVLSHPNGWEGTQQSQMRSAAILAGLIPDTPAGNARLSFVTEGEASLHFAIQNGLPPGAIEKGEGVIIVDAGGGTIDISSYRKNTTTGNFEEITAPKCHFHGSVFITLEADKFLEGYLADSSFSDDIEHIVTCFDKTTKLRFRNTQEPQYIKFGSSRDHDPTCNIRSGQLKLTGTDVASFFEPSIECIVKAVVEQQQSAHKPISHVVLVGGLAASDYVFQKVKTLAPGNLNIMRPESHVNKAVSDGAISFYLDHFVRARVSKLTYGTFIDVTYRPDLPDHRNRASKVFVAASGDKLIRGAFDVILSKNTQVLETQEFRKSYWKERRSRKDLKSSSVAIWCYRGPLEKPRWEDVDTENYTKLCIVDIDLGNLPCNSAKDSTGAKFYRVYYDVVLIFGLTELRAQIAWLDTEKVEHMTEARIIYDADG